MATKKGTKPKKLQQFCIAIPAYKEELNID
jgi:hypothetical protein